MCNHAQRGQATLEFVLVMPVLFTAVFLIIALAISAALTLYTGAVVPVEVRDMAVGVGSRGRLDLFAGVTGAGTPGLREASDCERAVYGETSGSYQLSDLPYTETWDFWVRAGSVSRDWRFWPGPPEDYCQ